MVERIRKGDVYTYFLNVDAGIRQCKRPFIVVEVEQERVVAAPLTTNIRDYRDEKRVYSTLTVNGNTKEVCILADMLIKIPINKLEKKIAHVSPELVDKILYTNKKSQLIGTDKYEVENKEIHVTDENEMMKCLVEVHDMLKQSTSVKNIWFERIISFVLGIAASVLASYIYQVLQL